ncbi:phage virion morphogenesis protein [Gluconobacter oxydans]|uniref:phage virion morphogenesis protein n=1 Tax=Gluconobacter oxydans TaxID=442 RepID=UPI0034643CFD
MQVRGDWAPVRGALEQIAAIGRSPQRYLEAIGRELGDNTRRRFDTNIAPDGSPWAPLNPLYAENRKPLPILVQSGQLRQQLPTEVRGNTIIVGSSVKYGGVHQFGATIVPRTAKALRFRIGAKKFDVGKVVIPARPYLGFGAEDRVAVVEQLELALELAMRAR